MKAEEEDKKANKSAIKVSSVATLIIVILLCTVSSVSAAELQVHECESIQAAINMANPGDIITVHNGTYTENVVVNKSDILIRSANGSAVTIVQSNRTDRHVFNITDQKNVTLDGFTVRDASEALNTTVNDIVKGQEISALVLPPEYQVGAIRVTSNPSGATVILDDFVGPQIRTPHTFEKVPAGYSEIELYLDGYQDWTKRVRVTAGETTYVDATLTPISGSISVTSSPADAKIYLDDRYRGKTPHRVADVSPGYHTLRLTLDGYRDWSTNLQVRAGETSDVAAIMIPSFTQAGIYMNNASNCVIKNNKIINITATGDSVGIAVCNSVGNKIQGGEIINCGQGLLIVSGWSNIIEENIIRDNTIAGAGVRIERSATTTGICENCSIDNVPQAWDDGRDNNWIGNYRSPPPGGSSNYIIPGAAGSEDKDPLDECPMTQHERQATFCCRCNRYK
nr:hypothetical secreted protein, containing PEGA domains [uncultured archaeon]CBH39889.1 hypothetical secreted protein, containing PEGA domains [uncultured archaeon]